MKKQRVRIVVDNDPMNPREWDNAGRMYCWHSRYNLGDKHDIACDDFMRHLAFEVVDGLEDRVYNLENDVYNRLYDRADRVDHADPHDFASSLVDAKIDSLVNDALADCIILPLYLMDHSGITMSVGPFGCPWDSGRVGYIICDKKTIDREFNGDRELAEKQLRIEVSIYDDYLTGNIYGFIVEESDDDIWEHVDSCYGFYGSNVRTNGMSDHLEDTGLIDMAENADIEFV